MARDPRKLEAFQLADDLVVGVYRATRDFPSDERYGLRAQIRRGAVSVAANLVEGSSRPSQREYLHFIQIAMGSASEVRYLIELATRLEYLSRARSEALVGGYDRVLRALQALTTRLSTSDSAARSPKPEARSPTPVSTSGRRGSP